MAGSVLQNPFAKQPAQPLPQPGAGGEPQLKQSTVIPPEDNIDDPTKQPIDPNKKKASDDPMMDFSTLWENPPVDPEHPEPEVPSGFLPKIDPAKIAETLGKIDFSKSISPEESAAIKAGGDGAQVAHLSVLNKSLRQSMMTMFNVAHKMVEQGLTNAEGRFLGKVPSHVKDIMVGNELTANDPLMSHPAFAPLVESTRQRFQEKFPKATPAQISKATKAYIQEFVKTATKPAEVIADDNTKKLASGAGDADWSKWIEEELKRDVAQN